MQYYEPTMDPAGTSMVQLRPDYRRVMMGFQLAATKRLSNNWMANLSFGWGDAKVYYDSDAAYTDPTEIPFLDGNSYASEISGSGKSSIFINSRRSLKATAMYQFRWDINVSGYFSIREGFVHPIRVRSPYRNHFAGRVYTVVEPLGSNHLPNLTMFDLRVEKAFPVSGVGRLGLILDVFNVFNTSNTLGLNRNAYQDSFGDVTEIVNPRIIRLGVRFQF